MTLGIIIVAYFPNAFNYFYMGRCIKLFVALIFFFILAMFLYVQITIASSRGLEEANCAW